MEDAPGWTEDPGAAKRNGCYSAGEHRPSTNMKRQTASLNHLRRAYFLILGLSESRKNSSIGYSLSGYTMITKAIHPTKPAAATEEQTSDKAINDDVYNYLLIGRGDCDGARQK